MKFSIIVPAYNEAQYIEECVESVLNQDYDNFEVIVVDDGATDETPQIIDSLAQKSKKVKVIHQKNGGLSAARNSGIEAASGDYILFLDGDDFWSDNSFLTCLDNMITKEMVDVVIFPFTYYYQNKLVEKFFNTKNLSANENIHLTLANMNYFNKEVKRIDGPTELKSNLSTLKVNRLELWKISNNRRETLIQTYPLKHF